MVNYNMGRYYAWSNLSQQIKSAFRRHFYTPKYNFTYIPPKVHTNIQFLPFEEWKASILILKQINNSREASTSMQLLVLHSLPFLSANLYTRFSKTMTMVITIMSNIQCLVNQQCGSTLISLISPILSSKSCLKIGMRWRRCIPGFMI